MPYDIVTVRFCDPAALSSRRNQRAAGLLSRLLRESVTPMRVLAMGLTFLAVGCSAPSEHHAAEAPATSASTSATSASTSASSVSVAEIASGAAAPPPAQATGLSAMLALSHSPEPLRGMVWLRSSKGDDAKDVYRHSLEALRKCNDVALERTPTASGDLSITADVVSRDDRGQTRVEVKQSTSGSIRDKGLVDCVKSALEPRLLDLGDARVELSLDMPQIRRPSTSQLHSRGAQRGSAARLRSTRLLCPA